ncbi:MAG: MMPL family transporter [Hyphomicrobiales bacterium]
MLAKIRHAHRIGQLSLSYPKSVFGLILLISVLSLVGIDAIKFDDGVASAFRSQNDTYLAYRENRDRFTPSEHDQAIVFTSPGFDDVQRLAVVRDFALEISLVDGVEDVFSIFSLRQVTPDGERFDPIFPPELAGLDDALPQLLETIRSHPLEQGQFLSSDLKTTLVMYHQNFDRDGLEMSRSVLSEIQEAAKAAVAGTDVSFEITGLASIRQILIDSLLGDLLRLNLIGMTLGFVIALIALRSVTFAFLTSVPSNIALFWSLGSMGHVGIPIDTLTNVIPVLILVLSLADSLHMTFETRCRIEQTPDKEPIRESLAKIGPACVLTSITTAIAFSTLLISESELVRNLGLAGLMSTLIAAFAVLLVHPLVFLVALKLNILPTSKKGNSNAPLMSFNGMTLVRFSMRHAKSVTYISILVLLTAVSFHTLNRSNYSFISLVDKSVPELLTLRHIETELAPTMSIDVPIEIISDTPFSSPVLQDIGALQAAIEDALPDSPVFSLVSLTNWLTDESNLQNDSDALSSIFKQLPPASQKRLLSDDGGIALLRVQIADHGATQTNEKTLLIQNSYAEMSFNHILVLEPTGLLPMSATVGSGMIKHMNISFLLAVFFSGILMALWFGHWRYGFFCIAPNVLPIAVVGGWLFVMGWPLEMPSAVALTIAFGIAVDDTIHVLNRLKFDAPLDKPLQMQGLMQAFGDVSPVLVTTTAVLAFGTLGSQWSNTPAVAYFGALTIAIFILALGAVLVVLPAWLNVFSSIIEPSHKGERPQ